MNRGSIRVISRMDIVEKIPNLKMDFEKKFKRRVTSMFSFIMLPYFHSSKNFSFLLWSKKSTEKKVVARG